VLRAVQPGVPDQTYAVLDRQDVCRLYRPLWRADAGPPTPTPVAGEEDDAPIKAEEAGAAEGAPR